MSSRTDQTILTGTVDAPWGPVRVAAGKRGVLAIEQLVSEEDFLARLAHRFGRDAYDRAAPAGPEASAHLQAALTALEAFFDGELLALADLPLDLADLSAWDRLVLGAVRELAPGSTASYGDVARMIGKPGAARAVGGAVGRNPIGLAIPCHRVISGDGSLGGYGAGWWGGRQTGLDLKRELLAREGVSIRP
ncbi:MAG TPA: methylated-DNA--[protein]-cysteine S-methyltransferase [Candidatus Limnocylindrales bacterium]|nr:methylated-DNA--[protein]-cysteine S-methyltransferase [Candidatus Limnocylindrales bacterium]